MNGTKAWQQRQMAITKMAITTANTREDERGLEMHRVSSTQYVFSYLLLYFGFTNNYLDHTM
jgi:hypothetical protein